MFVIKDVEKEEDKDGGLDQVNGHLGDEDLTKDGDGEESTDGIYPTIRAEDSGLGISASPSEQHFPLGRRPQGNGFCKEGGGLWRKGGSVDTMTVCLQDILAFITTR